jgi:hypothetical protein
MPGAEETYPTEAKPNHYYAARQTDAAPIEASSQREKFLFYRGVGQFPIPVSATEAADGRIAVKPSGHDPVAAIIAFENRDGKIGYDIRHSVLGGETLLQPRLSGSVEALAGELAQVLIAAGLFEREARAMVETWRDTWFEHGARVFYIVPDRTIDTVLPLDISPRPSAVRRVFVGRVEVITAECRLCRAQSGDDRRADARGGLSVTKTPDAERRYCAPQVATKAMRTIAASIATATQVVCATLLSIEPPLG